MSHHPDRPRILTLDIETAPIEAYVWGLFDQNIGLDMIKTEWSILCYSAKWLGDPKMIFDYTGGRGRSRVRDDKKLMRGLWKLLDKADLVVAQNGLAFDVKKINSRLLEHGLTPYSPIRVIDTLIASKSYFANTSNKLAWTSAHYTDAPKSEHKLFPGFDLWKECLADNPKAWAEMKHYNIQDVIATEKLYLKLRPWIHNHPNVSVFSTLEARQCPKCGGENLKSCGIRRLNLGAYRRYRCLDCKAFSRGKGMMLTKDKRHAMLTN